MTTLEFTALSPENDADPVTSRIVEELWTPVIGPSSICVLRRLALYLDVDTFIVELDEFARMFGLSATLMDKTLQRLCRFGILTEDTTRSGWGYVGYTVRTSLPHPASRHLERIPSLVLDQFIPN